MRRLWTEACEKDDLEGFTKLAVERNEIYARTMLVVEQILRQQRLALGRQQYLNAQSSFYNYLNATTSSRINYTGIPTPTYTYGAADVGYGFETQFGVEGARLGKQAMSVVNGSMGDIAKVEMLENIWKEVE